MARRPPGRTIGATKTEPGRKLLRDKKKRNTGHARGEEREILDRSDEMARILSADFPLLPGTKELFR